MTQRNLLRGLRPQSKSQEGMGRARGATRRGEPLSSTGASNKNGAVRCQLGGSKVPAKRV